MKYQELFKKEVFNLCLKTDLTNEVEIYVSRKLYNRLVHAGCLTKNFLKYFKNASRQLLLSILLIVKYELIG